MHPHMATKKKSTSLNPTTVLVFEPGKKPKAVETTGPALEDLQKLVGGFIQVAPLGSQYFMVFDEDGLQKALPPHQRFYPLVGNVVIVRHRGQHFGGLNPEEMEMLQNADFGLNLETGRFEVTSK